MNLPLKEDDQFKSFESVQRSSDDGPNKVALDLNWSVRSRIVDLLMINHNIALLEGDSMASECKSRLVDQNNNLAYELLKLRCRIVAALNHLSVSKGSILSIEQQFLG